MIEEQEIEEGRKIGSSFARLLKEMNDRPWYEKIWSSFTMMKISCRYYVADAMGKQPGVQRAVDNTIYHIMDDIEFGYNIKMIYGKMCAGSYDNTPIPHGRDWFSRHDIDWDEMMAWQGHRAKPGHIENHHRSLLAHLVLAVEQGVASKDHPAFVNAKEILGQGSGD